MNIEEQYNGFSVYKGTRSKSQNSDNLQVLDQKRKVVLWVSATKTYNALTSNHLVDWLNLYGTDMLESDDPASTQFMQFLFKRGHQFEKMIVNNILAKMDVIKIANYYSRDAVANTLKYMKEGVPVIWSAPLANQQKATYGIADLLIRSDMFSKIFKTSPLSKEEESISAPKLKKPYHYRVVDVKYCTIPITVNGIIVNQSKFIAYKGQLNIYNDAIGKLQGYTPPASYLLGRRVSCNGISTNDALDQLGIVDFENYDQNIIQKTNDAIKWFRKVQRCGSKWGIDPPSILELCPNMSIESGKWNPVKKSIAVRIGEISLLWRCGETNRTSAIENSVVSFYDRDCNGEVLGFKNNTRVTIDNIINVNRLDSTIMIKPSKIKTPTVFKNKYNYEFYIDFETFTDICPDIGTSTKHTEFNMIFMIGIGWEFNGTWNHRTFIADDITMQSELALIKRFQQFIKSTITSDLTDNHGILFYWSADESLWKQALTRHNISLSDDIIQTKLEWYNMPDMLILNNVAIRGTYDYKLKNIASAMKTNSMICTNLESDCTNGAMAMIRAWQCYQKHQSPSSAPIMKDIAHYNHYDCKVMYDILMYFKTHIFN
jgi:hypothetical protein